MILKRQLNLSHLVLGQHFSSRQHVSSIPKPFRLNLNIFKFIIGSNFLGKLEYSEKSISINKGNELV